MNENQTLKEIEQKVMSEYSKGITSNIMSYSTTVDGDKYSEFLRDNKSDHNYYNYIDYVKNNGDSIIASGLGMRAAIDLADSNVATLDTVKELDGKSELIESIKPVLENIYKLFKNIDSGIELDEIEFYNTMESVEELIKEL